MRARRIIQPRAGGCSQLIATVARAALISVLAGSVAFVVGGDELRGAGLALLVTPLTFIVSLVFWPRKTPARLSLKEVRERTRR